MAQREFEFFETIKDSNKFILFNDFHYEHYHYVFESIVTVNHQFLLFVLKMIFVYFCIHQK